MFTRPTFIIVLSALSIHSARSAQVREPGAAPAQDPGVLGTAYPQPADVLLDDALVHQDQSGGCDQILRDLAAAPAGGFAAVWSDTRNGNLGLYAGFMNDAGEVVGVEQPVSPPRTSRQFEPSIAVGTRLTSAIAWYATSIDSQGVALRLVDPLRGASAPLVSLSAATPAARAGGAAPGTAGRAGPAPRGGAAGARGAPANVPSARRPSVAQAAQGGFVAWSDETSGSVAIVRYGEAGAVLGEALILNPSGPPATGAPQVAVAPAGEMVVVWPTAGAISAWTRVPGAEPALAEAGPGLPLRLIADPAGGWWLLARDGERARVRHLALGGAPDRDELAPYADPVLSADLALFLGGNGLALLVEPVPATASADASAPADAGGAAPRSAFELHLVSPTGTRLVPIGIPLPSAAAVKPSGAKLAANGDVMLVSWTDRRNGDADIYYRCLRTDQLDRPDERWNTDRASAQQFEPDVAANGERAVIAWQDERAGAARIYARRLDAVGAFAGDEIQVAPDGDAAACAEPVVAVRADGSFLVAWHEGPPGGGRARARTYSADAQALAPGFDLDPSQTVERSSKLAASALGGERGYQLAWVRSGGVPVTLQLGPAGAPAGTPAPLVAGGPPAQNLALALLDDQRLVAAWDVFPPGQPAALFGRFLDAAGAPLRAPFALPASPQGGDWDPALAPGPDNGFALAWCGNDGPERDIFARLFDQGGNPSGALLPVSVKSNEQDFPSLARLADGSFAVAWEDDISYRDHTQLRRIAPGGAQLGPPLTLNRRETRYVEDRFAPRVAALGAGVVGVWTDCRRSKSKDVFLRLLGGGFDRLPE